VVPQATNRLEAMTGQRPIHLLLNQKVVGRREDKNNIVEMCVCACVCGVGGGDRGDSAEI